MRELMTLQETARALGLSAQWVKRYAALPDGDPKQLLPVDVAEGVRLYLRRDVARVATYRAQNPTKRGRPRKQVEADLSDCA